MENRSKWIVAGILILVLGVLCVGILAITWFALGPSVSGGLNIGDVNLATVSAKATEQKSFTVSGQATLDLDTTFGDVRVTGGEGDQIRVTADKKAWGRNQAEAEKALQDLVVTMTQDGSMVTVRVEDKRQNRIMNGNSSSASFTVSVPRATTVIVRTDSGQISLGGTQGKADLTSKFGDVSVTDVQGGVSASSNSGNITARQVVLLADGNGDASLRSDFGNLTLEDATTGRVDLVSKSGKITLTNVQSSGDVTLDSNFGDVAFKTGKAKSIKIDSGSGSITLTDIAVSGAVAVAGGFGDIDLTHVQGASYTLKTDSGRISADGVQGALTASTRFGDVVISGGQKATLQLTSNSGKISYRGSLGDGPHKLQTDFGDVSLSLPKDSAFDFDLRTDFGEIKSDFEVNIQGAPDEEHWAGQVNGGGPKLTAITKNGGILLQAQGQ